MPFPTEQLVKLTPSGCDALISDQKSRLAVIVTHPWGPLGGSMHNNVVGAAVLYFHQHLHITTIRFNFCGTQVGFGMAQVQQVQDVATALLAGEYTVSGGTTTTTTDNDKNAIVQTNTFQAPEYILLVGYSYGSLIALSASATIAPCVGVVSIAPPFGVQHWLLFFQSNFHLDQAISRCDPIAKLFVTGTRDNFTSETRFKATLEQKFPNDTGAVIKDADHFFARREKDVMDVIGEWLTNTYGGDLQALRDAHFVQ